MRIERSYRDSIMGARVGINVNVKLFPMHIWGLCECVREVLVCVCVCVYAIMKISLKKMRFLNFLIREMNENGMGLKEIRVWCNDMCLWMWKEDVKEIFELIKWRIGGICALAHICSLIAMWCVRLLIMQCVLNLCEMNRILAYISYILYRYIHLCATHIRPH